MKIVVDSSAFLAVVLSESERERIVDGTQNAELIAPEILPYEIGNALSAMLRRKRLKRTELMAAWDAFIQIPVRLAPCDIPAALEIAAGNGIYAYDAYFLQITARLRLPLLTVDAKMRSIGEKIGLTIMEI